MAVNITLSIDDDLLSAAKATAVRRGTSVTSLVRSALEQQVALDGQVCASGASGALRTLMDYSMGVVPRGVAMQALGLSNYGELIHLLNLVRLPHPLVSLANRSAMTKAMVEALRAKAS
jgi:hypothetical protein